LFSNTTKHGGAEKLGHMYIPYLSTHGLSCLYEKWNVPHEKAAIYGVLSSFFILGYVEAGDSFSQYGFSYEDLLVITLGSFWVISYIVRQNWPVKLISGGNMALILTAQILQPIVKTQNICMLSN
jgi:hypothetical protein